MIFFAEYKNVDYCSRNLMSIVFIKGFKKIIKISNLRINF